MYSLFPFTLPVDLSNLRKLSPYFYRGVYCLVEFNKTGLSTLTVIIQMAKHRNIK